MTRTTAATTYPDRLQPVAVDPLRDIHKGIRAALFGVTAEAARVDPSDDLALVALEAEVRDVVRLLADHAGHEDAHFGLAEHAPQLASRIDEDHAVLEARMTWVEELAAGTRRSIAGSRRFAVHELHLELASFTGAYLAHQDFEERVVVPALEQAIGVEALAGIHGSIVGGMSPDELTRGLVAIFPAINIDDRVEMLAGMQAGAPPEAFEGLWRLATSLLAPEDAADLGARLGR